MVAPKRRAGQCTVGKKAHFDAQSSQKRGVAYQPALLEPASHRICPTLGHNFTTQEYERNSSCFPWTQGPANCRRWVGRFQFRWLPNRVVSLDVSNDGTVVVVGSVQAYRRVCDPPCALRVICKRFWLTSRFLACSYFCSLQCPRDAETCASISGPRDGSSS